MLSEQALQLLTAYIDGELTRRQRKAVLRLLHHSSEARSLLRDLQINVHKLRNLPRHALPVDFAADVMQAIQDVPPPRTALPHRQGRRWIGIAAAAAILVAVVGGYLLFSANPPDSPLPPPPVLAKSPTIDPWLANIIDGAVENSAKPQAPGVKFALNDLVHKPKREHLTQELKKAPAFHLDLTVCSSQQTVQRIGNLFKEQNITLIVDAEAKAKLTKDEPQTQFVLFAENLQPEELAGILEQLTRINGQPKKDAAVESLWMTAFTKQDQTNLAKLMGAKPEVFLPTSDLDPLFKETIIEKKSGSGGKDKSAVDPTPKETRPQRYAVVLANRADGPGAISSEVKTFLATRRQQRPGTVQVVVVFQSASA